MGHVFISYSHSDLAYVQKLTAFLTARGIEVWFDDEAPTEERWRSIIQNKIETAESVLVIMSPAAEASGWVARDIDFASSVGKRIVPLLLDGEPLFALQHIEFADVRGAILPDASFVDRLRPYPDAPRAMPVPPRAAPPMPGAPPEPGAAPVPSPAPIPGAAPVPSPAPMPVFPPMGASPQSDAPRQREQEAYIDEEKVFAPGAGRKPDFEFGEPEEEAATVGRARKARSPRLEFTAAYRREVEWDTTYPLLFYVLRPEDRARVTEIIGRRAAQLGGAPAVAHGVAAKDIRSGTTLTIVPTVLGVTFTPDRIDVVAEDDMRELTFQMTVPRSSGVGIMDGYIDIFVGPLIIGQVPVSFEVPEPAVPALPKQPGVAELLQIANVAMFDTIFASYSHRDAEIVDLCVTTYKALGVDVLIDREDLRSGDDWRQSLTRMIEDADIFQLFWSASASTSREVETEWRQALKLSGGRDRFIRPVYWEQAMPQTPPELGRLHFGKLDLKALRRVAKEYAQSKPGFLKRALSTVLGR